MREGKYWQFIFKREEMYGIIKKAEKGGESVGIFLPQPKRGDP